jgi:putative salt-induced outer membrane protein YdiY
VHITPQIYLVVGYGTRNWYNQFQQSSSLIPPGQSSQEVFVRQSGTLVAVFFLFSGYYALADQVSMKNGDRLTGTLVKSDGKTLVLHTDYAGDVTLNWSAIQSIEGNGQIRVEAQGGKTAVGAVTTSDSNLEVRTSSGRVELPMSTVTALSQESEYEKTAHPSLLQGWKGGVNAGFSLTGGNSQTTNLALGFLGARQTLNDKLSAYANSVYATSKTTITTITPPATITTTTTTANTAAGGARYDRNFDAKLFGFGSGDFFADALQSLNLRSTFSGGLGYHAIHSDRTTLDLLGGLNYTRESYVTLSRDLIALTLGEELMHKIGTSTVLNQKLYFFPDLNSAGNFRGTFNFASVTKLNKHLGWQNSFSDIYVTNPPAGKRQNDVILTTGLNVSFGQ